MKYLFVTALLAMALTVALAPAVPRLMNYCIMALYAVTALWWLWNRSYADVCYWLSAFAITATVTFGYNR